MSGVILGEPLQIFDRLENLPNLLRSPLPNRYAKARFSYLSAVERKLVA